MPPVISFDDSLWPLVLVRFTGAVKAPHIDEFLTRATDYLERGESYITISDLRHMGIPPIDQSRRMGEWLVVNEGRLRERVICNAILVTSAPIRLSLSLAFHLKPQPMPHRAVSTLDAALAYSLGMLRDAGRAEEAERIRRHFAATEFRVG